MITTILVNFLMKQYHILHSYRFSNGSWVLEIKVGVIVLTSIARRTEIESKITYTKLTITIQSHTFLGSTADATFFTIYCRYRAAV